MNRLILIVIALGLAWLGIRTARSLLRAIPDRTRTRTRYLSLAAPLLTDRMERTEPTGFARMAGSHGGLRFDLQALPDTLAVRKLPVLWVMVTLTEPQDLVGETHVMARATGQESFSRFGQMPCEIGLPPGFPPDCTLRCSRPDAIPPPEVMERLAPLFRDPRMKEVVLSPQGLRLVVLGEEADRTSYLLFRDAELGAHPFPAERLQQMLADLIELNRPQKAPA